MYCRHKEKNKQTQAFNILFIFFLLTPPIVMDLEQEIIKHFDDVFCQSSQFLFKNWRDVNFTIVLTTPLAATAMTKAALSFGDILVSFS